MKDATGHPVAVPPALHRVELAIGGMTCASCAARIEKKLNRVEGVTATVNYATERATVTFSDEVTVDDLIATVIDTGYTAELPLPPAAAHDGRPVEPIDDLRPLRQRLIVSAVLAVPVIALAMIPAWQFTNWQWISLALAGPVVVYGGSSFHRATWINLRHGASSMDTLVSVGTLAAFGWSVWALLFGTAGAPGMVHDFTFSAARGDGAGDIYLEAASAVTVFLLAGRYFEARAKRRSGAALRALLALGAKDVAVLRGGVETRVPIGQLIVGDRFVVRPGEKIATDGVIEHGTSAVDAAMLTGEPIPIEVTAGDTVTGGTINVGGRLLVRANSVGSQTQLAQIVRLVEDAQAGKAPVQRLADRISAVFVPVVIALAAATVGFWLGADAGVTLAFTAGVAVLIIACPCALGLATPTALLVGTGRGAQLGLLIKGPEILESTRRIDTVLLDKTGTITTGQMTLVDVTVGQGSDPDETLRLVGAIEAASEHPVARAIAAAATQRCGPLPTAEDFVSIDGLGVRATVDGREVVAGRQSLMNDRRLVLPPDLATTADAATEPGRTVVFAGWDGEVRAVLGVADTVKPGSAAAVRHLRQLGLRPMLLTGDHARVAEAVASSVGIDDVIAEVLPAGKAAVVTRLQAEGHVVAMVGDGINDAAALAAADLGLAIGTGTDVAIEAADLTLTSGDLHAAVDAIRLSRSTLRTIKGNLFWAFAYNVISLPLAMAGLLNPMIAGAAMALSSVFVVSNSLRLRRFRPVPR